MSTYFCVVRPEQINGKLAAYDGQIVYHLPNYTEIFIEEPALNDSSLQVFTIEVRDGEVRQYQNGEKIQHLLWKGDQLSRSRPQDLVSVAIVPTQKTLPSDVAKAAFSGLPKLVQLSAVLSQISDSELAGAANIFSEPDQVRNWTKEVMESYLATQKG